MDLQKKSIFLGITLVALFIIVLMPFVLPSVTLATEILIFAMAALACNLLLGYAGLLSFGQGAFFGTGAYISSIMMIHFNLGVVSALFVAMISGALLAYIVGFLSIRRKGIYFVMLTLAFSQMAYFIAYTLSDWTGGDNGLLNVPRPSVELFGYTLIDLSSSENFYLFVSVIFLLIFIFSRLLIKSPFGTTLVAIRENEDRASAVGFSTNHFKVLAFIFSGAMTGIAGGLYAMLLNFAPLSNIDLQMSENILVMTIIGGTSSILGPLLGSAAIVLLGDTLSSIWPRWIIILGVALIFVVLFMPRGLWGGVDGLYKKCREIVKTSSDKTV